MTSSQFWVAVGILPLGLLLMFWRFPFGGRLHLYSTLVGATLWLGLWFWVPALRTPRYIIVTVFFVVVSLVKVNLHKTD